MAAAALGWAAAGRRTKRIEFLIRSKTPILARTRTESLCLPRCRLPHKLQRKTKAMLLTVQTARCLCLCLRKQLALNALGKWKSNSHSNNKIKSNQTKRNPRQPMWGVHNKTQLKFNDEKAENRYKLFHHKCVERAEHAPKWIMHMQLMRPTSQQNAEFGFS